MRTRSSSNLIVEAFTIPKRRNRKRSKQIVQPELRTIIETPVATMADTRTMSELLQAPTEGYGDAIVLPAILAKNFELKVGLLTLVTSSQFHGFERDDPYSHIHLFNKITSTLKYKNVPHDAIKLMLFPFSLKGAAQIWLEKEPPCFIHTWEDLVSKFVNYFFPPSKTTNLKNDITNFQQRFGETFSEAWDRFKDLLPAGEITALTDAVKVMLLQNKTPSPALVKAMKETCVTCGGPHPYYECLATDGITFNASAATGTYNQRGSGYRPWGETNYHASNQMRPPGFPQPNVQYNLNRTNDVNMRAMQNKISNMKTELKNEIQTMMMNQNNELKNMMKSFIQIHSPSGSGSLPSNTIANPRGNSKVITTRSGVSYDGPTISPTSSPLLKEVEHEPEATKDKVKTTSTAYVQPLVIQVPIPEPDLDECLALADLGASINLMSLSVRKKLSLLELTPTRMTLELANRSVAYPVGVAEDVFVKVGKFHFPADFVVVDYDVDPRVPLILGRPFLRTTRALIDVYGEELTLRVNNEAITFNVGYTSRYSYSYDDESVNRIDVIDVTCEGYAQEVLGYSNSSKSGNPTPSLDPIITTSSSSLTTFEGGDFVLEEIEACLTSDSIPPGIDDADFDPEGDILLLEKLLNDDPSSLLPLKELHFEELKIIKSSIDDPLELELKDLPSHLEYAFFEGTNKLPIIIAKNFKDEEKARLLKVLKLHKRAISWKISDIKGIDPQFCTHKILMEDDFKLVVQHQRRVNPKIHEGRITIVTNEDNELIPTRLVTGWRVCIDYHKLNGATRKDHFLLPFMDQILERLAGNEYYCLLDGFSRYFHIHIDPQDQEKTTFTCPYGMFSYRPFETLKKKLTEALILVAPDWDLPFEIMCDASDFVVGAVLGQRAENLVADHLLRLKNPHQADLEKKEINETFPLETFGMISFHGDSSTPWFADIANYHVGNFVGIDFKGPFSSSRWNKYILVAVDYLSKWIEAKVLPTNDARVVEIFLKSLFARFGTPRAIISDRGTHFCNEQFAKVMLKYGVTHRLSTAYHLQTSGQVEVSNHGLKRILERTVGENRASWSDKLDDALWSFCTTFKTPIGCTPYKLVYEKACYLPIELEHKAY
ncbi:reverse transcriptase domain-containing protein [Tanacetum coccineum]